MLHEKIWTRRTKSEEKKRRRNKGKTEGRFLKWRNSDLRNKSGRVRVYVAL